MQLVYPWFLLGLMAVAIPILIHLLQLRKLQRVRFTNTAFIQEVELKTVRHRQVQELLILLARLVALVALVVAFCQPLIPSKVNNERGLGNQIAVSVDNTYSMQRLGADGQRAFEGAVEQARRLGKSVPRTSKIRLSEGGRDAVTNSMFLNELDELRLSGKKRAKVEVEDSNVPLYLFSDFQRNDFSRSFLEELFGKNQVVLIPLAGKAAGNLFVDSLWLDDAFVRPKTNVGLHVRVRNGGNAGVSDCPVKVVLASRQVAAFRVSVEAGESASTLVQVQLPDEKQGLGQIVVEDNPVTFDNAYYFALQPAAAIRVLEIGEVPVAQQVYGNEPLFAYTFAKTGGIDYGALRQANLVLLHELPQLDAGLREALGAVLRRGGNVALVPPTTSAGRGSYQLFFKAQGIGIPQWETAAKTPERREVAMPNGQESFFRNVFGAQPRAVTMPRVAPVLRWARTGTDLLRLRDGESYLAEFSSGAGKVYVFSSPLAKEYSDFAEHALFVPVMYRMAMLSYRSEQLPAYRLTENSVVLQLAADNTAVKGGVISADEARLRLVKDSMVLIPAQRVQGNEVRLELPAGMDMPGFYQVKRGEKVLTTLAFNADKRESELAAYSAEELRQMIGPNHPNIRVVESGVNGAGLADLQAEQAGTPLWRYFLLLALLALLAEAVLVRFGRRGARVPSRTAVTA
jgi:hypothetical protein